MRVTITDGSAWTGLFAEDQSIHVVQSAEGAFVGVCHPSGGYNVVPVDGLTFVGLFAPDGSLNVIESDPVLGAYHESGALRVEIISGVFT